MTTTNNMIVFPFSDFGEGGMILRDYFAAKAMQSLIVETGRFLQHCEGVDFRGLNIVDNEGGTPTAIAEDSYAMADAMLKARSK
jgi:hypothetical protein